MTRGTRAVGAGGVAFLLSFPAAALVGLLWRFPVPFSGYVDGFEALVWAPAGMIFYMLIGGFVAVPLLGVMLYHVAARAHAPEAGAPDPSGPDGEPRSRTDRLVWAMGASAALTAALFLAGLELIIGPW